MIRPSPAVPGSTYRLQIHGGFTFDRARELIPYLKKLGISHIYTSPIFQAAPGSTHGYDIVDYNQINEEAGGEVAFYKFAKELKSAGMGLIVDFVPNHMGIRSPSNKWWYDVLENGPGSRYASYFDIDWDPVKRELKDNVLLPILGESYGAVLENGDIKLTFNDGAFEMQYFEHILPVRPGAYPMILEYGLDLDAIHENENGEEWIELLSILTAIRNLPSFTTRDADEINELAREKEVIKRRLKSLYDDNATFRKHMGNVIRSYNGRKGVPESFDLMDRLLGEQAYRLCYWGVATEEINYRRFFDINHLGAIRMEEPEVFQETHGLIGRLIGEGLVDGLRIDHPDGLYNPSGYFQSVQQFCFRALSRKDGSSALVDDPDLEFERAMSENADFLAFYVVGEKILESDEPMPDDWPISGTTGYRFLNSVNGIFVREEYRREFDDLYREFVGGADDFESVVTEKKRLVLRSGMSGEINTLGHYLDRISEKNRHTRDFTLNSLTRALAEVIACFPVYRTYVDSVVVRDRDRRYINMAVNSALKANPEVNPSVFEFVRNVLLMRFPGRCTVEDKQERLHFVMRFQQITGPVMAKGMEDTTFYVYNKFVSLNEVGSNPGRFGLSVEEFHERNLERKHLYPHAMNTSSTHDTKRSEDVRARLDVISEMPWLWREVVYRWSYINRRYRYTLEHKLAPVPNDEFLLYQSIVGIWPLVETDDTRRDIQSRLRQYMIKASREAKVNTSWLSPAIEYEQALVNFIDSILDPYTGNRFLKDFRSFVRRISEWGMFNSLSMLALKILSPGMPDFYQGTELWDFSLVDPDNRRDVDFEQRSQVIDSLHNGNQNIRELLKGRRNGRIKMFLIQRLLELRSRKKHVFDNGDYVPLYASGTFRSGVVSFVRRSGEDEIILIAPRFFTELIRDPEREIPVMEWKNTVLNFRPAGNEYRNILTGKILGPDESPEMSGLLIDECMDGFPVAILEKL